MHCVYLYLLAPWCRVLLEKLTGLQPVKKFPAFHGTRMFITAIRSVRHLSLSWASPIQSIYSHPTSWRSILILSTHLRLGLHSGLLLSGFPSKTLYTPLSSPIRTACTFNFVIITIVYRGFSPIHVYIDLDSLSNGCNFCRQQWIDLQSFLRNTGGYENK